MKRILLTILVFMGVTNLIGCEQEVNVKKDPMLLSSELLHILHLAESMPEANTHLYERFTDLYGELFKTNATKEKFQGLVNVYSPVNGNSSELSVLITGDNGLELKVLIDYNEELDEFEIYDVQVVSE